MRRQDKKDRVKVAPVRGRSLSVQGSGRLFDPEKDSLIAGDLVVRDLVGHQLSFFEGWSSSALGVIVEVLDRANVRTPSTRHCSSPASRVRNPAIYKIFWSGASEKFPFSNTMTSCAVVRAKVQD